MIKADKRLSTEGSHRPQQFKWRVRLWILKRSRQQPEAIRQICPVSAEIGLHPSESCEEKEVVLCIKAEMEKLGFDKVEIDGLGNVIGWMGQGEKSSPSTLISIP